MIRRTHLISTLAPALALALLLFAVVSARVFADQGHLLGFAKSSSMTQNTTNVINGTPQPGTLLHLNGPRLVVRSVPLGQIKAGETIKAFSEVEVTNDLVTKAPNDPSGTDVFHDIAAGLALIIADSPAATAGIEVSEEQGIYVTPQMHHWVFEKSGTFTAAEDHSDAYLNMVMWAYGPNLTQCWTFPRGSYPSPQQQRQCGMDVVFDHGHLSALRTAAPTAAQASALPFSFADFSGPSVPEVAPADIPIRYGSNPVEYIVALSRPVGILKEGDILTVHSELQADARDVVQSSTACNVLVATQLFLGPNADSLVGARVIGDGSGDNFTGRAGRPIKNLERGVVPSSTTFELDRDYTTPRHVLLRVWSAGNSACEASGNGIRVKLSQAQSFLHVTRYRPEPEAGLVSRTLNSGDDSELASQLDVIDGTPASVYSLEVENLAPGDQLQAFAEVEVNTAYHRAAVHSTFVLTDSPGATTGTPLQVDNFTEVSPFMGSLPIHDATGWTVPAGVSGTMYLNLVMWGEHLQTLGMAPDDEIQIAPDAGRLVVEHLRPVDNESPATPVISAIDPASPANRNDPALRGSAEAGSIVRLFRSEACQGAIAAEGSAAAFAVGLAVTVPDNATSMLSARVTDRAGNASPCAAPIAFTEDSRMPQTTVSGGPKGKTRKRSASFSLDVDEAGSGFECSLDGAPFAPCTSPLRLTRLRRGPHALRVVATDAAGNSDASPARRSWRVVKRK